MSGLTANHRLILLNIVLLLILLQGGRSLRKSWLEFRSKHQASLIVADSKSPSITPVRTVSPAPVNGDWTEVSTRNPFSFDRNDIAVVSAPPQKVSDAGPKPVLFGTAFLGKETMAMMASGRSANRMSRPMKVGETIDGWVIRKIDELSVIVEADDKRETLIMNDPMAAVPRDASKTAVTAPAVSQVSAEPAPQPSVPAAGQPPSRPTPAGPAQAPAGTVIQTPFGNIVVKNPPQ